MIIHEVPIPPAKRGVIKPTISWRCTADRSGMNPETPRSRPVEMTLLTDVPEPQLAIAAATRRAAPRAANQHKLWPAGNHVRVPSRAERCSRA